MRHNWLIAFACLIALPAHAEAPKRIVCVGGALTEIVYALGAQSSLVGVDTTSYWPAATSELPRVGYQRTLSAEGILSLTPDLVIVNDEAGPPTVLKQLEEANVELLRLKAGRSLEDVEENIHAIGKMLQREKNAAELIAAIESNKKMLDEAVAKDEGRKRVMFILQHGGGAPMVAGKDTAADSIIALSGGDNVVTDYDGYKPLTPEAAAAFAPDVILITDEGLKQAGGKEGVLEIPGIALTPAGKEGNIVAMDSLLLLGFGPRTIEAALELNHKL